MVRTILFSMLLSAAVLNAAGDPTHEECERKIRQLESRLETVEAALQQLLAERAPAVAPTIAAPVASTVIAREAMPSELIPEIGKIGAEVGVLASGSANPFRLNRGGFLGGFIDLPLFEPRWMHGKVAYEIMAGLSQSNTTFDTTSNVAQVANLAVLNALYPNGGAANIGAATGGTGPAPFPVTTSTRTRMRLLEVVPFSFKYTSTALDRWRIRPYGVLGFGAFVTIHDQIPTTNGVRADANLPPDVLASVSRLFGGTAPFGGPLVAGQISQSPELEARGLPGGHGNIDLGLHSGVGFEWRLHPNFSLGFDARYSRIVGTNGGFTTYGSRVGFHF